MKARLLATVGLVLSLAAGAWAAPITLQAQSLHTRPGLIAVDPSNETVVQLSCDVQWSAYKAPWLQVAVSPHDKRVLLFDATATSGQASVAVWVAGDSTPLQLDVRVSANTLGNHVYFIACGAAPDTPPAVVSTPMPSPSPSGPVTPAAQAASGSAVTPGKAWDEFVAHLTPAQWSLLQTLIVQQTAAAYTAFAGSLSPGQAAVWADLGPGAHLVPPSGATEAPGAAPQSPNTAAAAANGLPSWAAWQAQTATTGAGFLVSYSLTNTGPAPLILDIARLQVVDANGAPIDGVSLTRQDTSGFEGRVTPGDAESGVIRIPVTPPSGAQIRWTVVQLGSGTSYVAIQDVP